MKKTKVLHWCIWMFHAERIYLINQTSHVIKKTIMYFVLSLVRMIQIDCFLFLNSFQEILDISARHHKKPELPALIPARHGQHVAYSSQIWLHRTAPSQRTLDTSHQKHRLPWWFFEANRRARQRIETHHQALSVSETSGRGFVRPLPEDRAALSEEGEVCVWSDDQISGQVPYER